jgi:TnpA family transposase
LENILRERPAYFQKIGLNAIVAADTAGVSSNHMQNAEKHQGWGELNVQASDGAEKSTKSVRLAMAQKRGEQGGRRGVEVKK